MDLDSASWLLPACGSPRLVVFPRGERGRRCIRTLSEKGHAVVGFVLEELPTDRDNALHAATGAAVYVRQPSEPMSAEPLRVFLQRARPDLIILAGCRSILPVSVLSLARIAVLNLHAGRLPEYRGTSIVQWQILRGESHIGCTIHIADEGIDTGPVVAQRLLPVPPDATGGEMMTATLAVLPDLLVEVLDHLTIGAAKAVRQDGRRAAYYRRRHADDGRILWTQFSAVQVHNLVRALNWPGRPCAFTMINGRQVGIRKTSLLERRVVGQPGRVLDGDAQGVLVMCADQALRICDAAATLHPGQRLG